MSKIRLWTVEIWAVHARSVCVPNIAQTYLNVVVVIIGLVVAVLRRYRGFQNSGHAHTHTHRQTVA